MDTLGSLSLRYAYLRLERLTRKRRRTPGYGSSIRRIWSSTPLSDLEQKRATSFWRKPQKIIERKDCWYACFDLSALPENKRNAALWLQIGQWAPTTDHPQHWIIRAKDQAMVWLWDSAAVPAGKGYCVPESLLYPAAVNKICHHALREGYELQYWDKHGVLRQSQWSPVPFDAPALHTFYLSIGTHAPAEQATTDWQQPAAQAPAEYPRAWPVIPAADKFMFSHYLLTALLFFAISGAAAWLIADIVRIKQTEITWQNELNTLTQTLAPQIQTRQDAFSERQQVLNIAGLLPQQSQLELISRVITVLSAQGLNGARITRWAFADGRIEAEIAGISNTDRPAFVTAMQETGNFSNIRVDNVRRSDKLRISAMPAAADRFLVMEQ